jgi:hypothetical protein
VALVTLDRLEHLLAALDRVRRRRDLFGQLELLGRLLEGVGREGLEVGDEVPSVLSGRTAHGGMEVPGIPSVMILNRSWSVASCSPSSGSCRGPA